jgi:hypothetical protein
MNVHSYATRSTSIAFFCAKLAQPKNVYLPSRAQNQTMTPGDVIETHEHKGDFKEW